MLEQHDRTEVEVWGLCSSPHIDGGTALARARCDHWLELRHASDLELGQDGGRAQTGSGGRTRGYTGSQQHLSTRTPAAPVQLSYLGYFAPSYLKSIDGWIGDEELFAGLDEVDRDAHKLWMVEGGYMAYEPTEPLVSLERKAGQQFPIRKFQPFTKIEPRHSGTVSPKYWRQCQTANWCSKASALWKMKNKKG